MSWLQAARLFGESPQDVTYLPSPSLTPYQETQASLVVRAGEAIALDRILSSESPAVVCTPRALFLRLPPEEQFLDLVIEIGVDEEWPLDRLVRELDSMGYRRSDLVAEVGTYAVRGGVFDLHPAGEELPLRLDFFGDTVESIKAFDAATQRSVEPRPGARTR